MYKRVLGAAPAGAFILIVLLSVALQRAMPYKDPLAGAGFSFNERVPTMRAEVLQKFQLGYDRLFSTLLWLRFLVESPVIKIEPNTVSWIYFDFDTISRIDPEFEAVFSVGGPYLSVITEDKWGAEQLLRRGLELFPGNWKIASYLAYHLELELGRPEEAVQYYELAARSPGAPANVRILGAAKTGRSDPRRAVLLLEQLLSAVKIDHVRDTIKKKIEKLRKKVK